MFKQDVEVAAKIIGAVCAEMKKSTGEEPLSKSERRNFDAVMIGKAPPGRPRADYASGLLVVTIDPVAAQLWAAGTRVGFDEEQAVEGGTVRVILEKDFACLDRPAGDAAEDARAFPNPSVVCK